MRKMFFSFKADVCQKVITDEKTYEHRKVFPNKPIEAYLYVSTPVKMITGIMHLNSKIDIESRKTLYADDADALKRIDEYLKRHKYAMEISDFQETNMMSLEKLREDILAFVVPQMYCFMEESPLLNYLHKNISPVGSKSVHDFSDIKGYQICKP